MLKWVLSLETNLYYFQKKNLPFDILASMDNKDDGCGNLTKITQTAPCFTLHGSLVRNRPKSNQGWITGMNDLKIFPFSFTCNILCHQSYENTGALTAFGVQRIRQRRMKSFSLLYQARSLKDSFTKPCYTFQAQLEDFSVTSVIMLTDIFGWLLEMDHFFESIPTATSSMMCVERGSNAISSLQHFCLLLEWVQSSLISEASALLLLFIPSIFLFVLTYQYSSQGTCWYVVEVCGWRGYEWYHSSKGHGIPRSELLN